VLLCRRPLLELGPAPLGDEIVGGEGWLCHS
jgi:hypothetical protein